MKQTSLLAVLFSLLAFGAGAIETSGTFQQIEPGEAEIPGWTSGWGNSQGLTGWDYVGYLNGASGVYLGRGWVLTAGHVGAGSFTLQGTAYSPLPGSAISITHPEYGLADLALFQIQNAPALPSLTLAASLYEGETVVMLGYGGSNGGGTLKTWGQNTVAPGLYLASPEGYNYQHQPLMARRAWTADL